MRKKLVVAGCVAVAMMALLISPFAAIRLAEEYRLARVKQVMEGPQPRQGKDGLLHHPDAPQD